MPQLILTIVLIAIGWFILIRPQQSRIRTQRAMVESLEVGEQVVTAGGIHGRITALNTETVQLEVAPGTELTVARPAIMRRVQPQEAADDDVTRTNDEAASSGEAGEEE